MGLAITYSLESKLPLPALEAKISAWFSAVKALEPAPQCIELLPLGFKVKLRPGAESAKFQFKPTAEGFEGFSGCKTQFAALSGHGGITNFLIAHKMLVAILDAGKQLGLVTEVFDDGDYWEKRDEQKLLKQMQLGAEMIAWLTGTIKDSFPGSEVISPITAEPSFENLEARGAEDLNKLNNPCK